MEKIRINNFSFFYDKYAALKDISFDISGNGLICLVGPNGSGKSTLLKGITGLLKVPGNKISINGKDINSHTALSLAKQVSYVPQINAPVYGFTVREVAEMGRHPYGLNDENKMVDYALQVTNTMDFMEKDCSELSGGELQRVMIARAIAQDTPIMVLDEPVSHLDIKYQIDIIGALKRLSSERNTLILTSMHDLNLSILYSNKIILLDKGKLHSFGTPELVLNKENITGVYKTNISEVRISENICLIYPAVNF